MVIAESPCNDKWCLSVSTEIPILLCKFPVYLLFKRWQILTLVQIEKRSLFYSTCWPEDFPSTMLLPSLCQSHRSCNDLITLVNSFLRQKWTSSNKETSSTLLDVLWVTKQLLTIYLAILLLVVVVASNAAIYHSHLFDSEIEYIFLGILLNKIPLTYNALCDAKKCFFCRF